MPGTSYEDLGTPGEKIDLRGACNLLCEAKGEGGELMNACAEPYGVARSAGASRRCLPWYSAASESRRQRQFIASSAQRRKRLRHGGTTTPNSRVTHGVVAEANRAARPGSLEQRTEEHHLYHVNLSEIPLLSRA